MKKDYGVHAQKKFSKQIYSNKKKHKQTKIRNMTTIDHCVNTHVYGI